MVNGWDNYFGHVGWRNIEIKPKMHHDIAKGAFLLFQLYLLTPLYTIAFYYLYIVK